MGELKLGLPVSGATITSIFDEERRGGRKHKGIDYAALKGTPVKASERGVVIFTHPNIPGYGKLIIINHTPKANKDKQHIYTLYAHLDNISVNEGDSVGKDKTIGAVGHTGFSTSKPGNKPDHLHFEVFDTPWRAEIGGILKKDGGARKHRENPTKYLGCIHKINGTTDDLTQEQATRLINAKISYKLVEGFRMAVLVDGEVKGHIDELNKSVKVTLEYDEEDIEKLMVGPMPPPKKSAPLNIDISIKL